MKEKIIQSMEYLIKILSKIQTAYNYFISILFIISWLIINYANLGLWISFISLWLWRLAITEGTKQWEKIQKILENISELKEMISQMPKKERKRINNSQKTKNKITQESIKSRSKERKPINKNTNQKRQNNTRKKT